MDVVRIQYGSPGSLDVAGIGTLAGHVKEFLLGIIDRWQAKSMRQVELQERLALAEQLRFKNEDERENRLALARREEEMHALEVRSRQADIRRKDEENRALAIANFEKESKFAAEIVAMSREVGLTREQIMKVTTWIASREYPLRELVELGQILAVQEKTD